MGRIVPWAGWGEWSRAKTLLTSSNPAEQAKGIELVGSLQTWEARLRLWSWLPCMLQQSTKSQATHSSVWQCAICGRSLCRMPHLFHQVLLSSCCCFPGSTSSAFQSQAAHTLSRLLTRYWMALQSFNTYMISACLPKHPRLFSSQVAAWRTRGRVPVGVDVTASLVETTACDPAFNQQHPQHAQHTQHAQHVQQHVPQLSEQQLRLQYSVILVRWGLCAVGRLLGHGRVQCQPACVPASVHAYACCMHGWVGDRVGWWGLLLGMQQSQRYDAPCEFSVSCDLDQATMASTPIPYQVPKLSKSRQILKTRQ